jgi:hypothetical protein
LKQFLKKKWLEKKKKIESKYEQFDDDVEAKLIKIVWDLISNIMFEEN